MTLWEHDLQGRRSKKPSGILPSDGLPRSFGGLQVDWLVGLCVIVGLSLWAFWPLLQNDFVAWDDDKNFLSNPSFRGVNLRSLGWAWTTFHLGVYQPLAWMIFETEYAIWGLAPWGYHLLSIVNHLAVTVALWILVFRLARRARPWVGERQAYLAALGATLLFALHPLRVEVVAWVSCQGYLPCALLAILAALFYERAADGREKLTLASLAPSLGLFLASLLCKAASLGLPVALLAMDLFPFGRIKDGVDASRRVVEKWPLFLVSAVFATIGYFAKGASVRPLSSLGPPQRLLQASYGVWFYLVKTAVPLGLHAHHPIPQRISLLDPVLDLAVAGVLAISIVAAVGWRRWPGLAAAWLAYLAILAPNSGLVSFGTQFVADRYSYLSLLPWTVVAACLFVPLAARGRRFAVVVVVVAIALSILTFRQCLTWRDSTSLWTNVLACDDSSPAAHNNLGSWLSRRGQHALALEHFAAAARLEPESVLPYLNRGIALAEQGKPGEASESFSEVLRRDPAAHDARAWLAMALFDLGRKDEALEHSRRAVREGPDLARTNLVRGTLLARTGQLSEALPFLSRAMELDPSLVSAHINLGLALCDLGRLDDAESELRQALRQDPRSIPAHLGMGELYWKRGQPQEAARNFEHVLELAPGHRQAIKWLDRINRSR
jgi:tetratricopeptide (TPR) repeat protein